MRIYTKAFINIFVSKTRCSVSSREDIIVASSELGHCVTVSSVDMFLRKINCTEHVFLQGMSSLFSASA